MQDDGLLGVLLEIQAYAIRENCIGLMPLIDTVFDAASEEMPPSMWAPSNAADVLSRITATLISSVGSGPDLDTFKGIKIGRRWGSVLNAD